MNVSQSQGRTLVADSRASTSSRLTMLSDPSSRAAEAYRSLRASVKFADVHPPVRSVLLADTGSGDQHYALAANLAAAIALAGDSVTLIDSNLRAPKLHEYLDSRREPGLADWLSACDSDAAAPLVRTSIDGLQFLPAGSPVNLSKAGSTPADLLGGELFKSLLDRLHSESEFLVFDAPPLSEVGDGLAVAARVDAVLLLVRSGRTKRAAAQRAKESLDRIGARVLGAVLTDAGGRFRFRG